MNSNIAQLFTETATAQHSQVALIAKVGKNWQQWTFADLLAHCDAYAHGLSHAGITQGQRVILMVKPGMALTAITFALYKIGATAILIDPGMGYRNLLRCIGKVKPEGFIGIPKAHLFKALFRKPFKSVRTTICVGKNVGGLWGSRNETLNEIADFKAGPFPCANTHSEDTAAIIFTTGSTGPPKGVVYPHRVFNAQVNYIKNFYGIKPGDIDQPGFPLFGMFSTALGATTVIPDMDASRPAQVDPKKFIDSLKRFNVTYSFGSPAIWRKVSHYANEHNIAVDSLKLILMAGAPVPGDLIATTHKMMGGYGDVHTPYGATESLPACNMAGLDIVNETWGETCRGKGTCVGKPLPGIEVIIVEPNDGPIEHWQDAKQLPTNTIGEITIKGDIVTPSYFNAPEQTQHAKIADGNSLRHRIGDMGYIDEQGRLWFCGRKNHRVHTEGGTLYTIPCEGIFNTHPQIYRSALVGIIQNNNTYQTPVIILEPVQQYPAASPSSIDHQGLINAAKDIAQANKLTKDIKHVLIHPKFPVDIRHNAKIFREKLAIWAQKQHKK